MSTPDKCPHCGAVETRKRDGWSVYDCGSVEDFQTNLCRERAANAETRRDKEALRDSVSKLTDTLDLMRDEFRRIQARIIKQAATNAETNARLHDDALRRLLSAEAKLAEAIADAASWQQQADARLNDAVEFGRRAEKAEARVKELESLVILNTGYCEGALLVRIPTTERARIEAKTLGEAMPRKEP